MVQKILSDKSILALKKENNLSPGLINRGRRQYLDGELSNNNDQEVKKLETQVAKFKSIKEGCRLIDIKRSILYYRAKDNLNKKNKKTDIKKKIRYISYKHPHYGYRRITAQLRRGKVIVNHKRVLRMIRKTGMQGGIKCKEVLDALH